MSISMVKDDEGVDPTGLPLLEAPVEVPAPRVNLLPPEIAEQRAVRRMAAGLAGGVLLCAVAVGGGYAFVGRGEAAAHADLAAAQSVQSTLQRQQRALLPAQQAQAQMQAAQAALAAAMGNEVLWSRYLDDLRIVKPEGVRFTQVKLDPTSGTGTTGTTGASSSSGSTSSAGTATPGAVATLTLTGKARSQPDVAALLDQLAQIKGFDGVYLTSSQGDTSSGTLTYTVTASVTPDALSHRYTLGGSS
jgi:Tfp pilus assembly protein PilN